MPGDLDGGPGTSLATLYIVDREQIKSSQQDFNWHQRRLRAYLENHSILNRSAEQNTHDLAEYTRQFWEQSRRWTELPAELHAVAVPPAHDWISYCFASLNHAVAARDLAATQHWSGELASAAFSLDDLHRWLEFLEQNQLTALEFQRRCATLFEAGEKRIEKYDPKANISQFPAGVLSLNGIANYIEVEHQAERLFSIPKQEQLEATSHLHLTSGSLWVSPDLRQTYLKLQAVLSPRNQQTFNLGARAPYEHSYLVNMLFRTENAHTTDDLCAVLKKFDSLHPRAKLEELLSVLMYRGHAFGGLEWGDRFQPELIKAADNIKLEETDLQALEDACRWTNNFYRAPAQYGLTLTLRNALDQKRLDCVRATDMIGAIFRNAGRVGFCNVRWCSETGAHSVAGCVHKEAQGLRIQLSDGLDPPAAPELWPQCYFRGHAWPLSLAENAAQPYAVELYVRGLDSYVWMEGYIIRGPNAGWLTVTDVPYGIYTEPASTRKVFNGPYPQ